MEIINTLTTIIRLEIKYSLKKKVYSTKQSPGKARSHDYHNSSYKWNYQDSMQNQIGTTQYPEINTITDKIDLSIKIIYVRTVNSIPFLLLLSQKLALFLIVILSLHLA